KPRTTAGPTPPSAPTTSTDMSRTSMTAGNCCAPACITSLLCLDVVLRDYFAVALEFVLNECAHFLGGGRTHGQAELIELAAHRVLADDGVDVAIEFVRDGSRHSGRQHEAIPRLGRK